MATNKTEQKICVFYSLNWTSGNGANVGEARDFDTLEEAMAAYHKEIAGLTFEDLSSMPNSDRGMGAYARYEVEKWTVDDSLDPYCVDYIIDIESMALSDWFKWA